MNLRDSSPACTGSCRSCPSVGSCMDRIVCRCLQVTEHVVITAIREHGAASEREIQYHTEAGAGCGCCRREIRQYLTVYASTAEKVNLATV